MSTALSTADMRSFAELAGSLNQAVEREDRGQIRAVIAKFAHPEIEWVPLISAGIETGYRGHAGLARFYEDFLGTFRVVYERFEMRAIAEDTVIVDGRMRLEGKGSGVEVVQEFGARFQLTDGMVRRARVYPTTAEAEAGNA